MALHGPMGLWGCAMRHTSVYCIHTSICISIYVYIHTYVEVNACEGVEVLVGIWSYVYINIRVHAVYMCIYKYADMHVA